MEGGSKVFDKLSEVDTLVSDVIENRFIAVPLVFYVANLHLQSQSLGNLAALNHRGMLTTLGLLVFFHIYRACQAVDTTDIFSRFEICLLHLDGGQATSQ